jgi:exodeoxyribonuclease VII large subunit
MKNIISVSQLISLIKDSLESNFRVTAVWGEITNLSQSSQGHYYFNLSDNSSLVSCALFKMDVLRNPAILQIKEGDEVEIEGSLSLYAKRGTFQVIVKKIVKKGKGDLAAQFEALKRKLTLEGLFDPSKKLTVPHFPKKIAIITAINGAALQDFINVLHRRIFQCHLLIIPTTMQGDTAPASIIKALSYVETDLNIDLVVITRGGGSNEDLWAFNDEKLIRKLASRRCPVISAIGHQVDFTLVDFIADVRAETPTAAAEMISQKQMDLTNQLSLLQQKILNIMLTRIGSIQKNISTLTTVHLAQALNQRIRFYQRQLDQVRIMDRFYELTGVYLFQQTLDDLVARMKSQLNLTLQKNIQDLERLDAILRVTNPHQVLDRGYTYTTDNNGEVITNIKNFNKINKHQPIRITFKDGIGEAYKG